jgi:exodeoxyribonuclease VII small subunit
MNEMTFEEKIKKIEDIIETLEQGDEPLEKLLELFEQGILLIEDCRKYINNAELKFIDITKKLS